MTSSSFVRWASVLMFGSVSLNPAMVLAGGCGEDPVYERSAVGVTVSGVRVRSTACMEGSEVLTTAPANATVKVIAETDGWYKVNYNGTVGWMGAQLVKVTSDSGVKSKISDDMAWEKIEKAEYEKKLEKEKIALKEKLAKEEKEKHAKKEKEMKKEKVMKVGSLVGISEANFKLLQRGKADLVKRLMGQIVLRVQARGQAYLVNADGSLTLLSKAKVQELLAKPAVQNGTISLKGNVDEYGSVELNWSLQNMVSSKGFKVVVSEKENPVYPGNTYHYLSDADERSDEWHDLKAGKTYHFRVCEYLGGSCGVYSNNVTLTIPADAEKLSW